MAVSADYEGGYERGFHFESHLNRSLVLASHFYSFFVFQVFDDKEAPDDGSGSASSDEDVDERGEKRYFHDKTENFIDYYRTTGNARQEDTTCSTTPSILLH